MNEEYVAAAMRTNTPDYAAVQERLDATGTFAELLNTMRNCMYAGERLDTFKKHLMYGKLLTHENHEQMRASMMSDENIDIMHGIIGMQTEVAELIEAFIRMVYEGTPLDLVNVAEEIGDNQWYVAVIVNRLRLKLDEIHARNIAKLRIRFPERFSEERAINRDLSAEREALS